MSLLLLGLPLSLVNQHVASIYFCCRRPHLMLAALDIISQRSYSRLQVYEVQ
ncbi:hypothetical protein H6F97_24045 [Microcoleus sp. FACHB-1]|nr:hypothetical protein [Microcoleus sp. FACHB-1]